jgi:hypothetical protein
MVVCLDRTRAVLDTGTYQRTRKICRMRCDVDSQIRLGWSHVPPSRRHINSIPGELEMTRQMFYMTQGIMCRFLQPSIAYGFSV